MKRLFVVICWVCVICLGAFLRFDELAKRPFHADEATGARITANRMETGGGKFDPKHYHGPLFHMIGEATCVTRGESGWKTMSKQTLRLVPAVAGMLLVLVPLLGRRRFGDWPMLAAAVFLASSPLLVYYSRMFIHEILLSLFGMAALMMFPNPRRIAWAGLLIGLMYAIKETFAISMIAWTGAAVLLAIENRRMWNKELLLTAKPWIPQLLAGAALAILVPLLVYTDFLRHPMGAVDAVKTFFVYETVGGHDKSAAYYLNLLALPRKSGGLWWFGTPVVLLALLAYAASFFRSENRNFIRFVAYSALGHFAIYTLFAYKTPWLACLPWAHVCLLAGLSFSGLTRSPLAWKGIILALTGVALVTQVRQARFATGRLESDARNPFAYVPTRPSLESLEPWLKQLAATSPDGNIEPIAVVGNDYWPLPWYLRSFGRIGYFKSPADEIVPLPLVIATPAEAETTAARLESTHTVLLKDLRAEVPLHVFVRNDLWKLWNEHQ